MLSEDKIFILIVTYNAMPWIERCLGSCANYEVVIIDNASTDGTIQYIKQNYPNIYIKSQMKNLGFGQANNKGLSYVLEQGAQYVFLLNQDAFLQVDSIEKLVSAHKANPEYGILSPIHLNGSGERLDRSFSHCLAFDNSPDFYSDFVLQKPLRQIYETPFINAAGWLMTKEMLCAIGGFDPLFFHYGEDENYCQRALYHRFKIGVVPTAFMRHDREDRPRPKLKRGTPAFLNSWERSLKTKYGNINDNNFKELLGLKKPRILSKWKGYLTGDFKTARIMSEEIALLQKNIPAISKSRKQTIIRDKHYLK
ncbi:glycosyltransferase family 2 protein [Mesoflavibacter zeaxanthinifaciens]|uniref:glycosyltransferase family 2 protein n=1 Tax=Mesoflavibacter zeaxanthinifaciens TaxID=393060 RepID=UPI003A8F12B6